MNPILSLFISRPRSRGSFTPPLDSWHGSVSIGITVLLLVTLSLGCSKQNEDTPSPQLQTIIASWDGGKLPLSEWLHSFRELESPEAYASLTVGEAVLQLGHEWVAEKVLAERAREAGFNRDPKMVTKLDELREERLVALYLRQNVDEKIVIKNSDLKTFYEENKDRFMSPAKYTYYRIFVSNSKHGKEEAKRIAQECWARIENGANFHDMVGQYSDTPEPKKNQLHGPFSAGEMPAEIEKVILDTPLRHHSSVVERSEGYVILYPESKTEGVARDFNSVSETIWKELFSKEQTDKSEELLRGLQTKYQVTLHKELFDAAEVKPDAILLEINPGGLIYSWGEFQAFTESRQETSRQDREKSLELFARRKLLLNHAKQIKFNDTDYFYKRFRPVEARVLADYFMELKVDSEVNLSEQEILDYYDKNPDEFRRPSRVEAWHLSKKIRYPLNASDKDRMAEEQKVLGQLLEIRKRIMEQGESFVTWASRFTDYEDGGYLGWQPLLALPPAWVSVVATLEEGEISMPIRVSDTYELVLRGGLEDAGVMKFEVIRDKVEEAAKARKIAEARRQYIESLLLEVNVKYALEPAVDLIVKLIDRTKRPPQYWLDPYQ